MVSIIIGGDVCPTGENLPSFREGNAERIFDGLLQDIQKADLSIVNLECPLIYKRTPIKKNGPILSLESACINGLKQAGINVFNLANNHIMDHGKEGLMNTLKVCAKADIATVGAGENLEQARRILIRKAGQMRVGILAAAEHEFSIATHNSHGANPLDIIDFVRNIQSNKDNFDYLIVLLHGGNEQYPFPSPRLRDTCHFMVEMGANAVIVQHTHCPGCYELYQGAYIVYGQSDLIFGKYKNENSIQSKGFLVRLTVEEKGKHALAVIPHTLSDTKIGVRKMSEDEEQSFFQQLNERSKKLSDPSLIEAEWLKLSRERKKFYLFGFLPGLINNRLLQKINRYFPFIERLYTDRYLLRLENMVSCEAHREVIQTILQEERKKMRNS